MPMTKKELMALSMKAAKYLGPWLPRYYLMDNAPKKVQHMLLNGAQLKDAYAAWDRLDGTNHLEKIATLSPHEIINMAAAHCASVISGRKQAGKDKFSVPLPVDENGNEYVFTYIDENGDPMAGVPNLNDVLRAAASNDGAPVQ